MQATREEWKERIRPLLARNKTAKRLVGWSRQFPTPNTFRVIRQPRDSQRPDTLATKLRSEPEYSDIYQDLLDFTGLSERELDLRILRDRKTHFRSEFSFFDPNSTSELSWFYRANSGYLFANAIHPFWSRLEFLNPEIGKVLEYGGGIGHNAIPLARRGISVDYLEISIVQSEFVQYRTERNGLVDKLRILRPYVSGRYDPIGCVTGEYGAIILQDVLEHIPNYHVVLAHLIDHLRIGGLIIEKSPFAEHHDPGDLDIHLAPSIPLEIAMKGMRKIDDGLWEKIS